YGMPARFLYSLPPPQRGEGAFFSLPRRAWRVAVGGSAPTEVFVTYDHDTALPDLPPEERLFRHRHSAAHVLAEAVLEMCPDAKYAIGPPVDNGFYYDFDLPRPLNPDDLERLEKRMRESVQRDLAITGEQIPKDRAREIFASQPYKLEL